MTLNEKQYLAAAARNLIRLLQLCDDNEFAELVLACVASGDDYALQPERLEI